jgi:hypothetical protein
VPRRLTAEIRFCERCRHEYATTYPAQRFCGRACAAKGSRPNRKPRQRITAICPCGVEFSPLRAAGRYCSAACRARFFKPAYPRICDECQSPYVARAWQQRFCSRKCSLTHRSNQSSRLCELCGDSFRSFDRRRRFCSRECAYASARDIREARAANWKGGRTVSKQQRYVLRLAPGHPRAKRTPYVLEHLLVMESKLGRYLEPHERVHHMNGDRTDNRPENLELWKIKDPAGVRAVDYHCAGCTCGGAVEVIQTQVGTFVALNLFSSD